MPVLAVLTDHFRDRVTERFNGVSPDDVAKTFTALIEGNSEAVRYIGRDKFANDTPSRTFEADMGDGGAIRVVVKDDAHNKLRFITAYHGG